MMSIGPTPRTCVAVIVACASLASAAHAQEKQGFSASNIQVLYGATFNEPDIPEHVPKNVFTFENAAAGKWWSSYLFVDVLRSWSDPDQNAKEVYGEWYPSLSLRKLSGKQVSEGFVRDVSATIGLNTGVRSTGPARHSWFCRVSLST